MAGYSPNPLVKKLGIKPGYTVYLHDAPAHYPNLIGEWLENVEFVAEPAPVSCDFIHAFFQSESKLEEDLPTLKAAIKTTGMLWLSWPKKTSSLESDLERELIREAGLDAGLVDVKICAVDEDWSAVKFVYRIKDRG